MKKVLVVQLALLALVIIIGSIFKGNISNDILRTLHKIAGMLAGLASIVSLLAAFKIGAKATVKVLVGITVLTTLLAGAAGKAAAKGGATYSADFNRMRLFAAVSVLTTVGAYTLSTKNVSKKQVEEPTQN